MTYITTHGNMIVGIHKSQTDANAHTLKDDNGETITLRVLNVELPLHAEAGWYCNTDGSIIEAYPPKEANILLNNFSQAVRNHQSIVDAIMRSSATTVSMERLVDEINPIHRMWLLLELKNTMTYGSKQRVKEISTVITNLFFEKVNTVNDLSGNMETVINYIPVDTITSLTQSELDVRIASIRTAIDLARTNAKKWIDLDNASIQNAIRLADTHAFPEE